MKKEKCHCCGNYTLPSKEYEFEICPVCFWQYDRVAQKNATINIGPNHGISLIQARINYKKYGACKQKFKKDVRLPLLEELPENNE